MDHFFVHIISTERCSLSLGRAFILVCVADKGVLDGRREKNIAPMEKYQSLAIFSKKFLITSRLSRNYYIAIYYSDFCNIILLLSLHETSLSAANFSAVVGNTRKN